MWEIVNLKSVCAWGGLLVPKGCKTVCSSFFDAVACTKKKKKCEENASKILQLNKYEQVNLSSDLQKTTGIALLL